MQPQCHFFLLNLYIKQLMTSYVFTYRDWMWINQLSLLVIFHIRHSIITIWKYLMFYQPENGTDCTVCILFRFASRKSILWLWLFTACWCDVHVKESDKTTGNISVWPWALTSWCHADMFQGWRSTSTYSMFSVRILNISMMILKLPRKQRCTGDY